MTRQLSIPALVLTVALAAAPAHAEVKKEERNQVSFAGMLGRMVNLFGGKSAREGVVSTVAVSGDRKMTTSGDNTAQIIDLREEKIYDLDVRRKTYKVTTFEEIRRQMREAEAKAREAAARESRESKDEPPAKNDGKELEVDFNVKNTGQTKAINGFDTRQVIATVTVREKGKKIEESGGIVMTVDTWLSKSAPSLKEIADFDRRYYEKLAGPISPVDAQQLATAMAMFPGLKEAMARVSPRRLRRYRNSDDDHDRRGEERRTDEAAGSWRFVGVERRHAESALGRRRNRGFHAAAPAATGREGSGRKTERKSGPFDVHDHQQRSIEDCVERDGSRCGDARGV